MAMGGLLINVGVQCGKQKIIQTLRDAFSYQLVIRSGGTKGEGGQTVQVITRFWDTTFRTGNIENVAHCVVAGPFIRNDLRIAWTGHCAHLHKGI
jgi:uncharacterized protein affecting Mg2+/Co2+ transport